MPRGIYDRTKAKKRGWPKGKSRKPKEPLENASGVTPEIVDDDYVPAPMFRVAFFTVELEEVLTALHKSGHSLFSVTVATDG